MPLTDTAIRASKPKERPYKLADAQGLYLLVSPKGSRLWRLKYRIAGKEKLLAIGPYPAISLKEAREARDNAKKLLAAGADPSASKREAREAEAAATEHIFRAIADEYLDKLKREGKAASTLSKVEWLLSLSAPIALRPISAISASEVLDAVKKIEARGTHETANRLRATIGAVFRYAIATSRAENDPTSALKGALIRPVAVPRAAITRKDALGALLRAIDGFDGQASQSRVEADGPFGAASRRIAPVVLE